MKVDYTDKSTGEILKPYQSPNHLKIKKVLEEQIKYVRFNIKEGDNEKISRLNGDELSEVLMTLSAYYEYLSTWLAHEKLHLAELKNSLDFKFAEEYLAFKNEEGETNETARMKAKLSCREAQEELDKHKHGSEMITAWFKSIGRYHDAVRSQLSYEKSLASMTRN